MARNATAFKLVGGGALYSLPMARSDKISNGRFEIRQPR
jgi:hypothetical protein